MLVPDAYFIRTPSRLLPSPIRPQKLRFRLCFCVMVPIMSGNDIHERDEAMRKRNRSMSARNKEISATNSKVSKANREMRARVEK